MNEHNIPEQAGEIASLLVSLVRRLFAPDDGPVGDLPLAQLRVCVLLLGGPHSMSAVSRELGVTQSAMTQIADRLERAGLVSRVADAADRRVRALRLTPRGERIMRQREEARVRRVASALGELSPEARRQVQTGLELFARASAGCGLALQNPAAVLPAVRVGISLSESRR